MIPEGTPAGQDPTPVHRAAGLRRRRRSTRATARWWASPSRSTSTSRGRSPTVQMAQAAVHVSSVPPVPGKFYWLSDTQLRWRPIDFWPANTIVNIDAGGTKSSFRTGESLVATVDNTTHQMTVVPQRQAGEDVPGVDGQDGPRHPERHLLRAREVPEHRDGLRDLRRAEHLGAGLQADGSERGPHRQQRQLRAQRAVVGRPIRASATSATVASTSARPTRSGSTTTSAAATRSS